MSLKETKGYANFKGIISGLHNRKKGSSKAEYDWGTVLNFFLKTSEHNSIPVSLIQFNQQVGKPVYFSKRNEEGVFETKSVDWAKRTEDFEGWQLIGVSVRSKNHEDITNLVPIDAIEYIENNFNDGDSVFVGCQIRRSQSGDKTYTNYEINKIYNTKEELEFEADNFEEVTEFRETFVYKDSFADKKDGKLFVNGLTIQYGGKTTPVVYTVWTNTEEDKEVANYMASQLKFGDLVTVEGIIHNRVIGEWVENEDNGGIVGRQSKSFGKPSRQFITKAELKEHQIIGIVDIVEGAYEKSDFEESNEEVPEWLK